MLKDVRLKLETKLLREFVDLHVVQAIPDIGVCDGSRIARWRKIHLPVNANFASRRLHLRQFRVISRRKHPAAIHEHIARRRPVNRGAKHLQQRVASLALVDAVIDEKKRVVGEASR